MPRTQLKKFGNTKKKVIMTYNQEKNQPTATKPEIR